MWMMTLTCAGHFWTAIFIVWNFNPHTLMTQTHFVAQITEQIQRLDRLITTLLRCPEEDGPATRSNHDQWKRENSSRIPSYSVSQHDKSDPRRITIQLAYLCLPQSNAALWGESLLQSVNIETFTQIVQNSFPLRNFSRQWERSNMYCRFRDSRCCCQMEGKIECLQPRASQFELVRWSGRGCHLKVQVC